MDIDVIPLCSWTIVFVHLPATVGAIIPSKHGTSQEGGVRPVSLVP